MKDHFLEIALGAVVILFVIAFILSICQEMSHQAELRAHGCQLITRAETGRTWLCGKACVHHEEVFVYECADGSRTELR